MQSVLILTCLFLTSEKDKGLQNDFFNTNITYEHAILYFVKTR